MSEDAHQHSASVGDSPGARLLATAAALFRKKGYANSSTRELAALLGIRSASLYHHIEKKEDLLYALCVNSLNNIREAGERAISEVSDPLDRVRALTRAHLKTALEDRDKHATLLAELRELSDARRAEVLRLRDDYESLVRRTIGDAQAVGAVRQDVETKYLALALLNLLNWSIFWFSPGGDLTPEQLADLLAALFLEGAAIRRLQIRIEGCSLAADPVP